MDNVIDCRNKFKHLHVINHVKRIIATTDYADFVHAETYPDERTDTGLGVAIVTADGTSRLIDIREYDMSKIYPHLS